MSSNQFSGTYSGATTFPIFMQRVYLWMTLGLGLTGLAAFATLLSPGFLQFLLKGGMWLFFIAELILVFWISANIQRLSMQAASILFLAFSALNGVSLSGIFLAYTASSIAMTFFIAAGTFAGVSIYGWVTKQDLTSVGSFCGMALWGLIIASIVNIFFQTPTFYWILSYAGVAVFIGLTAYDTQKLKMIHQNARAVPGQIAIFGALTLYLDFINMFLYLLRIFGRRNN
ncbi:MAG TPA: Bax inhibitor-1/YccA family protein [Candidatus Omnitrophota bacterium]|nr:Bax inhibitor-1/YccA family protein [Candidatus Omnitrophota bacterium]HQB12633.1 Bax inhibitor-1/YccA family protein [Candidatus Omnitrophota bacterium]